LLVVLNSTNSKTKLLTQQALNSIENVNEFFVDRIEKFVTLEAWKIFESYSSSVDSSG